MVVVLIIIFTFIIVIVRTNYLFHTQVIPPPAVLQRSSEKLKELQEKDLIKRTPFNVVILFVDSASRNQVIRQVSNAIQSISSFVMLSTIHNMFYPEITYLFLPICIYLSVDAEGE